MAARQRREQPGNDYLLISQDAVTALLDRLGAMPAELELLRLRGACGYEPVPTARAVRAYLQTAAPGPVCGPSLADAPIVDFSGPAPDAPTIEPSLGRYLEDRRVYDSDAFVAELPGERRTLHLGVDVFLPAGEPILAPLDGTVRDVAFRPAARDWGGIVVIDHVTADGVRFHTLYGHLSKESVQRLAPGDAVARGDVVARLGDETENGGWAPHLHFQLLTTDLGRGCDSHGVGTLAERDLWESQSPDPNLVLGLPRGFRADPPRDRDDLRAARTISLSRTLSLSYAEPLKIVRGEGAYLYADDGRAYLDMVNNVCHVGHAHPRVVRAAAEQMARLNTNTRYLHDTIVTYARRLAATLPDPLSVVFLVNSGQRGERPRAAARPRAHGRARRDRARSRLPRQPELARRDLAVQVRRPGRHRDAGPRARLAAPGDGGRRGRRAGRRVHRRVDPRRRGPGRPAGRLPARRLRARPRGGRASASPTRSRSASAASGRAFWGFELGGVVPDIVTLGKPIGQRPSGRRGRDDAGDRALVRDRDGVLQHVRRQPGLLRGRARGARRDRRRAAAGPRGAAGRAHQVRHRPPRGRRGARGGPVPRRRARDRRGGDGGGRAGACRRRAAVHRRAAPQRAQAQAAARAERRRRRPVPADARRGAGPSGRSGPWRARAARAARCAAAATGRRSPTRSRRPSG